jgi:hypothetical protein
MLDRANTTIEHCNTTIAQLEAKITDPHVVNYDKDKLRGYRDFEQRCLNQALIDLQLQREKLERLQKAQVTCVPAVSTLSQ